MRWREILRRVFREMGVFNYLFKKCTRNKRSNLCFQDFSYIWNEPICLDSSFQIFLLIFSQFFFYFVNFFLTNFENDIFHEIPAAAARNPSRSSGYCIFSVSVHIKNGSFVKIFFIFFANKTMFFFVLSFSLNFHIWFWRCMASC